MGQLKRWFEEVCSTKVFDCGNHRFVARKGFKITYYIEDGSYTILDIRTNDFYTEVLESDIKILTKYGFIKGTDLIRYNRSLARVKDYIHKIEGTYAKKARYKTLLHENELFYTKRIKNCNENIHKYHDMMQFYKAQVEQFENKKVQTKVPPFKLSGIK